MNLHLDGIPVVQARAAKLGVGDGKSEGFDQVEAGAGGGAQAGNVAGVGRDFRADEDHMEGGGWPPEIELGLAGVGMFHGAAE